MTDVSGEPRLRRLDEGLYEVRDRISIAGVPTPRRMTVVRLADGSLWVCSANRLDDALKSELDAVGPVRHVVCPNRFHHVFVDDYQRAWPEARLYGAPGLAKKRSDLSFDEALGDEPPEAWRGDLEQLPVAGIPALNEVAFRHAASGTLVLTDLLFHVGPELPHLRSRLFFRVWGVYGRPAVSRLVRFLVKDRSALAGSLERVLARDFRRVLMAHGEALEGEDARATLRRAWQALGARPPG